MVKTSTYALLAISTALFGVVVSHLFDALQVRTGLIGSNNSSVPRAQRTAAMLVTLILGIVIWLCAAHISPHVLELVAIWHDSANYDWLGFFRGWEIYNDLLSSVVLISLFYVIVRMARIGTNGINYA